jgi:hypothetical protein
MLSRAAHLALLALLIPLAPEQVHAQQHVPRSLTPHQIIRRAVDLQLASNKQMPTLRFTYTKTTPHEVLVKDVIQTSGGEVSRLISINGKPLSPARNAEEQQRLTALLSHPSDQTRHRQHQVGDQDRVNRLIQQLPDALIFTPIGTQPGPYGPMMGFTFVPNPNYSPPDIESSILTAINGHLWVDQDTGHFIKFSAHLIQSVHVGWGIVATFQKGGSVTLANKNIGHNEWPITYMKLDVDGSALIFKPIHIHLTQEQSDFQFLPPATTWQQAVDMLTGTPQTPANQDKTQSVTQMNQP